MSSYRTQGRARASYPSFDSRSSAKLFGDRDILAGLSSIPLQTILNLSPESSDQEVKITDVQYAGSYNWVDKTTPTIIVPGSPRQWTNRPPPYQVHADDGETFKDQNGYRCPNSVLLPLMTAVNHVSTQNKEQFDWASIDFVTDRNNLRKLLRWINGTANDFRIDVQLAGKTVLLNRWENRYQEQMSGRTYGFNFEKASTRAAPGCEDSTGHHRIIRYNMDGLKLVVRFEVDACLSQAPQRQSTVSSSGDDIDDIIGALSSVSLKRAVPPRTNVTEDSETSPNINVIAGGSVVSQSSIIELTTRSVLSASDFKWKEYYPQLFLSQKPHHFMAVHQRGLFKEVVKRKLESPELQATAQEMKEDLKLLRRLLHQMRELVKKHGERGRLSFVCQNGELKVYERTNRASCLPDEALRLFDL
ncbi:hypothetical protein C0993_012742 [Termitomyces sp. T159_Od127]|nr:hypothetical protein C0993_012742 [Termitomyces sp. T159_Od127]